jgi:hypothetical protein
VQKRERERAASWKYDDDESKTPTAPNTTDNGKRRAD